MLVWNEISWRGQTCFVFNCWRFHLKTFDYDRLLKCSIGKSFGWVRLPNPIEVNRTIGVRLSSITERSIDYGGRMKFQLNSEITPGIHNAYVNFTFCWSSRNTGNLYICQLTKGFKSNSPIIKQSTHSTTLVDKVSLTWSSSVNPQTFVHPFGNTNVNYSDVLFGPFSSLLVYGFVQLYAQTKIFLP